MIHTPVAIVDLDAGLSKSIGNSCTPFSLHERERLLHWLQLGGRRGAVVPADGDDGLALVHDCSRLGAVVLAVVEGFTPDWCVRLLRAGAAGFATADDPRRLAVALECALHGWILVPTEPIREILAPPLPAAVTEEERSWLHCLGEGATVEALGLAAGHSKRTMERRLQTLYERIGVSDKLGAIVWAHRIGILSYGQESSSDNTGR